MHGRRLTALIPARGGSKGIPRKNLFEIEGETLVARAARLARESNRVDAVYVSTDDPETHAIAQANGCATPQLRPAALATDRSHTIEVVRDLTMTGVIEPSGCILLLQPTTPLRTAADLEAVCDLLEAHWDAADAVVSVGEIGGAHPFKAQTIVDGQLRSLFARDAAVPRQSLPPAFIPNGAFYLGKTDVLLRENTFMPARSLAYVMTPESSINLDGPLDLLLLHAVLEGRRTRR